MRIEMREQKHLWIVFNPAKGDPREVIIDEEHNDLRVCDGLHVVKVRWENDRLKDVLVDDIFVWRGKKRG